MNKIKYMLLAGVAALGLSSCSGDFLNTEPTAEAGITTVFENTDNAKYAVNGLARIMMNQYLGTQACAARAASRCGMATTLARTSMST